MNRIDAAQRKKGIRMAGIAMGLMMAPVCALAQTVATATSQAPVYRQAVPPAAYYYGPGMMGGWGPGYYGPGMMAGMMGGFGLFWGMLWLLVLVGIVGGILFLIRGAFTRRHRQGCGSSGSDSGSAALKLLDERYARGEITREEYQQMRKDLE